MKVDVLERDVVDLRLRFAQRLEHPGGTLADRVGQLGSFEHLQDRRQVTVVRFRLGRPPGELDVSPGDGSAPHALTLDANVADAQRGEAGLQIFDGLVIQESGVQGRGQKHVAGDAADQIQVDVHWVVLLKKSRSERPGG